MMMWTTPGTQQALRQNTSALPTAPVVPEPEPNRWRILLAAALRRAGQASLGLAVRVEPRPAPRCIPSPN